MPTSFRSTRPTCRAARTNGHGRQARSTASWTPCKTIPAVHLCFGNYGGQSIQKGAWAQLLSYLNALHADHIVVETAHRVPGRARRVSRVCGRRSASVSASSTSKSTEIESADAIARTLERAEAVLGQDRIKYINPDCGFWMLKRTDRRRQDPRAGRRTGSLRRPRIRWIGQHGGRLRSHRARCRP